MHLLLSLEYYRHVFLDSIGIHTEQIAGSKYLFMALKDVSNEFILVMDAALDAGYLNIDQKRL